MGNLLSHKSPAPLSMFCVTLVSEINEKEVESLC